MSFEKTPVPARPTGSFFLILLWIFLVVLAAGDFAAHTLFRIDKLALPPKAQDLIKLDRFGRVTYLDEIDLRWYIGDAETSRIATLLRSNSDTIDKSTRGEVRQALLEFQIKFEGPQADTSLHEDQDTATNSAAARWRDAHSPGPAGQGRPPEPDDCPCSHAHLVGADLSPHVANLQAVRTEFEEGRFFSAATDLRKVVQSWSPETQTTAGEASLFTLIYQLEQLSSLQDWQCSLVASAKIPEIDTVFWARPRGALLEAVIWSSMGTLVNLILNISRARSRGRYRASEVWISVSKIVYGPVLSLVLVLFIYFGIVKASVDVRFWLLPLLGFLFGYNTHKTAVTVDRLSEKLFGDIAKTTDAGLLKGSSAAAKAGAAQVAAAAKPTSIQQMKTMAPTVVQAHSTAAVTPKDTTP